MSLLVREVLPEHQLLLALRSHPGFACDDGVRLWEILTPRISEWAVFYPTILCQNPDHQGRGKTRMVPLGRWKVSGPGYFAFLWQGTCRRCDWVYWQKE